MTNNINGSREKLARMDELVMEGLAAQTDEELLIEATENGVDLEIVGNAGREAFERAQIQLGRNRLAMVKSEMALNETGPPNYNRTLARSKFKALLAANKEAAAKLTMAARNQITSKADEDIDGIIDDLVELDAISDVKIDKDR